VSEDAPKNESETKNEEANPGSKSAIQVRIPYQLQDLFGAGSVEKVIASDLREAVAALDARYPGMAERILEEGGGARRYVNLFVNTRAIAVDEGLDIVLAKGDVLWIIPHVAGG
jgi:MoaD family protein